MFRHQALTDERDEEAVAARQTSGLQAIAIILVLLIVGLFLVHRLYRTASIEDCLLSGRSNCDTQVVTPP